MPRSYHINLIDNITYSIIDFLVPYLIKLNVHPNLITLLGFIPIYFIYINILEKKTLSVYLFAYINYMLDCLDGELARKSGKTSKLGGYLDTLHDLTSIFSLLYLILKWKAIPILLFFALIIILIFKMNIITHEPNRFKKSFYFLHDNLVFFYFFLIEVVYRLT